ncbi:MAG TPA: patatin-like phospholipase family protein [Mycobacteriales bacterium]|nr:patatin-like phospholipase family protein [Mycobacteriales bacterium]
MTRRALVLGAGGVLGYTWMVAALHSLQQAFGLDARSTQVCVGTSAGSVAAALLGRGVSVEALLRHQRGEPAADDPRIDWDYDVDSGDALPPRPGFGWGSPRLTAAALRHPRRLPAPAALSGLLPRGRGTLTPLHRMVSGLSGRGWPDAPRPWLVALDYDRGRRVPFGRPGSPEVPLADAVIASCAIPGWYAPVSIGESRYVDGGTCSPASLNLLAGRGFDEVIVLAPMVSFAYDSPRSPIARAERRWRRGLTRRLLREAAAVRASGTRVVMFAPGAEDLAALGANLMDPGRRRTVLETALRTTAAAMGARRTEVTQ